VPPTLAPQISQQTNFSSTARLPRGHKIEPSIIVVIQCRDPPPTLPAKIRQSHALQSLPFHIPPQTDPRRACMRERQVHPAILVKVQRNHTHRCRQISFREIYSGKRREFPFARIKINRSSCRSSGDCPPLHRRAGICHCFCFAAASLPRLNIPPRPYPRHCQNLPVRNRTRCPSDLPPPPASHRQTCRRPDSAAPGSFHSAHR